MASHVPPGAVCIDIGGRLGVYSLLPAELVGPEGRVDTFEIRTALLRHCGYSTVPPSGEPITQVVDPDAICQVVARPPAGEQPGTPIP